MLDLLKSSGYLEVHDAITEHQLRILFEADPELLHHWVILSGDQRTRYGYYLLPLASRRTEAMIGWSAIILAGRKSTFPMGPLLVPDLSNFKLRTCVT